MTRALEGGTVGCRDGRSFRYWVGRLKVSGPRQDRMFLLCWSKSSSSFVPVIFVVEVMIFSAAVQEQDQFDEVAWEQEDESSWEQEDESKIEEDESSWEQDRRGRVVVGTRSTRTRSSTGPSDLRSSDPHPSWHAT